MRGGPQVDCQVHDYCSGGMLLSFAPDDPPADVAAANSIILSIELSTTAGPRRFDIPGSAAWHRDSFLGIQFVRPLEALHTALAHHEKLANTTHSPLAPDHKRKPARYLKKVRHMAQGLLPSMMGHLLGDAIKAMLETVDRVGSDGERQQLYGDISALEDVQTKDALVREVMHSALNTPVGDAVNDQPEAEELTLVGTDEFERWLEASRAASQLERLFGDRLATLGSRLSEADTPGSEPAPVPFEPRHFTGALKALGEQLELGGFSRAQLFETCIRELTAQLPSFYDELEGVLNDAGVPQAQQHRPLQIVHPSPRGGAPAVSPEQSSQEQDSDDAHAADVGASHEQTGATSIPVDTRLLSQLVAREQRQRKQQAEAMIDGLGEVTDGDPSMSEWLQMIHAALVDAAVSDPSFFQDGDHALRDIVDALGRLHMFQSASDDGHMQDGLREQVVALLEPIASGSADQRMLFSIAESVESLAMDQSEQYNRNVERVVQASEGRDRVRRAREAVGTEIDRRYAGRRVPAVFQELLDVGWRSVLELAWLGTSERQGELAMQFSVLDSVVAYLDGEAFEEASPALNKSELIEHIESQLESAAFDPFRRTAMEKRLRSELRGRATGGVPIVTFSGQGADSAPRAADARPDQVSAAAWQRALETCIGIRLGDQLRFVDSGEALLVAWIREDREQYTLVDHRGIRVRDIDLAELAAGLHQRTVMVEAVDGRPISGRIVEQMLTSMETRLSHLAAHDSLTGLINRQQFNAGLDEAVAAGHKGVLAWIDIDQFKLINDLHGYAVGDRLLVTLSGLLQRDTGGDLAGHLGADRFAVLLSVSSPDDALAWAESFCLAVQTVPVGRDGAKAPLNVSIGLVSLTLSGDGPGDLQVAVENALAAAKRAGGNQAYVYREDDPDISRQRDSVKWLATVDDALVDGELRLRCQPIVPVRPGDGMAPHYEVLLGVADSNDDALPIAEFIEAAERYKRMRAVDRWVTKSVFDWISAHRDMMPALHCFAVNLSGQTASDPSFIDFVRQQFRRTAIDPAWISFEVTETAAVASLSGTAGVIHDLKSLGCKVALDDFGSGLASYAYLKELPVDWLKIDGVFVRNIATDEGDFAVVKSINEIGHFLGKKTIAEYVENQNSLQCIREIGVDFGQGFGIARPMLMDELPQSLGDELALGRGMKASGPLKG